MTKHNRFIGLIVALAIVGLVAVLIVPHTALAGDGCPGAGVKVSNSLSRDSDPNNNCIGSDDINPIFALLATVIQFATGLVGLIMVLMIVIAGMQYVLSGTSAEAAKDAKTRIERAFTGFILFILMFAILQVLLPPDVRIFKL